MRLSATATTTSVDIGSWIQERVTPQVRAAAVQSAELVMDTAKAIVPVDTGRLRDSIDYQITEDALQITAIISPHTEYANRIEFGFIGVDSLGRTYNQAAQPYMRPAWDENQGQVFQIFNGGMARVA
jgi:HK97 gp10 family phage protein